MNISILNEISSISFCTCCHLSCHWEQLRWVWLCLRSLLPPFLGQVLMHYHVSRPNSPSSASSGMTDTLSPSSFLWSFPCLLYWGAQDWTQHSRCVSLDLSRREGSSPTTCWHSPNAVQDAISS